jgi:hypothetical protein
MHLKLVAGETSDIPKQSPKMAVSIQLFKLSRLYKSIIGLSNLSVTKMQHQLPYLPRSNDFSKSSQI